MYLFIFQSGIEPNLFACCCYFCHLPSSADAIVALVYSFCLRQSNVLNFCVFFSQQEKEWLKFYFDRFYSLICEFSISQMGESFHNSEKWLNGTSFAPRIWFGINWEKNTVENGTQRPIYLLNDVVRITHENKWCPTSTFSKIFRKELRLKK